MSDKKMPIALYVYIFPKMQEVAKKFGYALAIHGSCARDFDLVAIPWVKEAASMEVILEALRVACDGFPTRTDEKDSTKPHGRKSFSIVLGSDMFVDLSIMPLQPDPRFVEVGKIKLPEKRYCGIHKNNENWFIAQVGESCEYCYAFKTTNDTIDELKAAVERSKEPS